MVTVVRLLLAGIVVASLPFGSVWTGTWIRSVEAADAQVVDRRGTSDRLADATPAIVPHPQEVRWEQGTLHLPILRSIVLGRGATDGDRFAAELIRDELERLDVDVTVDYEGPETADHASISIRRATDLRDDAYRLRISREGAVIEAGSERGRFYGAMSLIQIVRAEGGRVPSMRVFDYPDLAVRGVMDDLVHQIPKLEEFKRIIRFLGEHKMNAYVLPVEGLFRFGVDPTAGMGTVSVEELIELQDYAASYHVDLIPALRTLGHFERLLRLPEFDGLAEYPGASTLNTQDSAAYKFVGRLLDEIVPVFRSDYAHIDGRRSDDVGIGASAEAVDSLGVHGVHLQHYSRVAELVHARGKKVMIGGDDLLDPNYGGVADDRHADNLSFADVVVTDARRLSSIRDRSSWTSMLLSSSDVRPPDRVFPDFAAARSSVSRSAEQAADGGAAGLLAAVRTRDDAPVLRAMQRREYAYAADRSWNTDPETADIDRRINRVFYGFDDAAMHRLAGAIGRMTDEVVYPDVWRHPLHHAPSMAAVVELSTVPPATDSRREAEMLLTEIEHLQTLVARNAQQLDYYAFAVRFTAWLQDTQALASWMMEARRTDSERSTLDRGARWARALTGEGRSLAQA
ncbi:MAG: glycoside hydrolase family 20 zincin-like fold domain-containing protein, partial [Rhodothermales bacterium]